ncbi:MAG TPA: ATP-dependent DNA helicase [Flavobacteriia bacterium]|nr:ATP-dependent DNA helicase [Flavobacteriia bacterium]
MSNYLDNLNEAQKQAVLQKDGPMIIIAGAGSGKTRVLTYRIVHLMQQGIDPFNILSLTFTNKAAREMKNRIARIVGDNEAKNLWMGTFHSVFARILRSESEKLGFPSNFTIYDTQDSVRLLNAIIKEMGLDKDRYKSKQVLSRISQFKNSLITVRTYETYPEIKQADVESGRPKIGEIYKNYVNRCFKAGAMDFDDLLLRTNELLTRFPDVLAKYQDRFRYIMVDEYQDTNHSQYLIVKALADRFQNICVVGDDSQSIYSFRGANIQNILNFQKDYPDAKLYKLEQNYRSSQNIVNAANSVITNNKTRLEKEVWTSNPKGEKIKVMRTISDGEEGRFIANTIWETANREQLSYDNFAILYRTNAQSRAMEDALRKKNIKYKIYGGLSFYQRKEIKDVLSYLRLLINPKDEEALKRVINYPKRGIGQTTIEKLTVAANHYNRSIFEVMEHIDKIDLKLNGPTKVKLANFTTMIKSFQVEARHKNAFEIADFVIKQTKIIKDIENEQTPEAVSRVENIQELLNGMKDFVEEQKDKEDANVSLTHFLEDVALATDFDSDKSDQEPRVSLMTIHLSKGLEFPYVYIVGMEENLFPSAMSSNTRAELEEERRLFYVALTRAEKQAYLSYAESRYRWGNLIDCEPSRFIEEIDEAFLENLTPKRTPSFNKFVNADIFEDTPPRTIRFKKPTTKPKPIIKKDSNKTTKISTPKNFKKVSHVSATNNNADFDQNITEGLVVLHQKFGKGLVTNIEGVAQNSKATIIFDKFGERKLLLKFAKLKIVKQ